MQILKAKRKRLKWRIGISGPSGSGKTYSALLFAYGITGNWGKICVIDTEVGSSNNYSHLGEFNVLELTAPFSPEKFIEAIKTCEDAGMEAIIIDSVSHEWEWKGGCLEINDDLAKSKFKGNTWAAWSEVTPRHQKFIEAIVQSKAHIITTSRSKTDTAIVDGKPKKVGIKDIQREWFEYEMTLMFNIDCKTHKAITSKDRTSLFIDRDPLLLSEKIWQEFGKWLESGIDAEQIQKQKQEEKFEKFIQELDAIATKDELKKVFENIKIEAKNLTKSMTDDLVERVKAIKEKFEITSPPAPLPQGEGGKEEEKSSALTLKPVYSEKITEIPQPGDEHKITKIPTTEKHAENFQPENPPAMPWVTPIPDGEKIPESEFVADSARYANRSAEIPPKPKSLYTFYKENISKAESEATLMEIKEKIEAHSHIFTNREKWALHEAILQKSQTFGEAEIALEDIPF